MSPPSPLHPSEVILRLVESVGRSSDADFYVRLFRQLPKSAFAIVAPEASALRVAQGLVVEHLRFLAHLGLHAPIVLGLFQPVQANCLSTQFIEALRTAGLSGARYGSNTPNLGQLLHADLTAGSTPVVCFSPDASSLADRFSQIGNWAHALNSRKLVLVRAQGGLAPSLPGDLRLGAHHTLPCTEQGVSVVSLQRDLASLLKSELLVTEDRQLLTCIAMAMSVANSQPATATAHTSYPGSDALLTSVTSPANLLHELFTVRGAGTLIKPGSEIQEHLSYQDIDTQRLRQLLEATFERQLCSHFFSSPTSAVYLEPRYRGVAIVRPGDQASFLTKFVVGRLAQGLGLGRDLWEVVTAHHPSLYWRSRPNNPVNSWYESQCEGRTRANQWIVYWRGIPPERIPQLVRSAEQQPVDFQAPASAPTSSTRPASGTL